MTANLEEISHATLAPRAPFASSRFPLRSRYSARGRGARENRDKFAVRMLGRLLHESGSAQGGAMSDSLLDVDAMLALNDDPRFITSIFNYCDRRCRSEEQTSEP